jgi:hypothetical protein
MTRAATVIAAGVLSAAAAFADVVALHPWALDGASAIDSALPGVWVDPRDHSVLVIREQGSGYSFHLSVFGYWFRFRARLIRTANATFLDAMAADPRPATIPVHLIVRLWINDSTLRFTPLDTAWFKEQNMEELACEEVTGTLVITSSTEKLIRFLADHGGDDRAYGDIDTLVRFR